MSSLLERIEKNISYHTKEDGPFSEIVKCLSDCKAALSQQDAHPQPQKVESKVPRDEEGFARTGNVEADSIINRLLSPDPDFDDCTAAAAYIYKLLSELKGPGEFATWKDAAIAERTKKNPVPQSVEEFIEKHEFVAWHTDQEYTVVSVDDVEEFMAGNALVPVEPSGTILKAMAESQASDDEGEFPALTDLINYSGENKTRTVLRAAYKATLSASQEVV